MEVISYQTQRRLLYRSMGMMKQDEELWTRFGSTGKIEDYLKYRTEIKNSSHDTNSVDKERNDGRDG